jgi:hypothetical protein
VFHWSRYTQPSPTWDHDHCHFCFRRFAEYEAGYDDSIEYGYTTLDRFNWLCKECFDKHNDQYGLTSEPSRDSENDLPTT